MHTLVEIVRALPGVYVDSWTIERTYGERTELKLALSCDEQPTPHEIIVRIEPTPHGRVDEPSISLTACAACGKRGHYVRSKYCDDCRPERVPF